METEIDIKVLAADAAVACSKEAGLSVNDFMEWAQQDHYGRTTLEDCLRNLDYPAEFFEEGFDGSYLEQLDTDIIEDLVDMKFDYFVSNYAYFYYDDYFADEDIDEDDVDRYTSTREEESFKFYYRYSRYDFLSSSCEKLLSAYIDFLDALKEKNTINSIQEIDAQEFAKHAFLEREKVYDAIISELKSFGCSLSQQWQERLLNWCYSIDLDIVHRIYKGNNWADGYKKQALILLETWLDQNHVTCNDDEDVEDVEAVGEVEETEEVE